MAFTDHELNAGLVGKTINGLTLSKTAVMTLEIATGSVTIHQTGEIFTLDTTQNYTFTSDPTYSKKVFMAIVHTGTASDLWVDEYVDDGSTMRANPPGDVIIDVAWFEIAVNETDLNNVNINRRIWI